MDENINKNNNEEKNDNLLEGFDGVDLKKQKIKIVISILLAVIIVAGVVLAIWQLIKKEDNRDKKIINNEQNNRPAEENKGMIYFSQTKEKIALGEEFAAEILIDTEGHNINAASLKVEYDNTMLKIVKIETDRSVLTVSAIKKMEDGMIEIVRGEPGDGDPRDNNDGYTGNGGNLATLIFKAQKRGEAVLRFAPASSNLLLDDGKGTILKTGINEIKYVIE